MWHKTRYVTVCCDQRVHKKSRIGEGLRDARTTCAGRSHSPMCRIMRVQRMPLMNSSLALELCSTHPAVELGTRRFYNHSRVYGIKVITFPL